MRFTFLHRLGLVFGAGTLIAAAIAYAAGRLAGESSAQYRRGFEAGEKAQSLAQEQAVAEAARLAGIAERRREERAAKARAESEKRLAAIALQLNAARQEALRDPDYARCDGVVLPDVMRIAPSSASGASGGSGAAETAGGPRG